MICSLPDKRAGIRVDENGALAARAPTANSGVHRGEWYRRAFAGRQKTMLCEGTRPLLWKNLASAQVALGLAFLFVMPFLARLRMISTPATRVSLDSPR